MIKKARKKPVVVETLYYDGMNFGEVLSFVGESLVTSNSENLYIRTLEGDMLLTETDYIIKGVAGEFYPCKRDIFHKTYEIIGD